MSQKTWFLHVSGDALGPLSTAQVVKMLTQSRANAGDFVWTEGMTEWTRIANVEDFETHLPETPEIAIPKVAKAAPAPKPKVVAKRAPEPEPEPEEEVVEEEVAEVQEEVAEETEEVIEEEPEYVPPPKPKVVAKPVAKVAPKPVAKLVPKPAPKPVAKKAPEPEIRQWYIAIDATVKVNGGKAVKVLDITEGGLICGSVDGVTSGDDVKVVLQSASMGKPMDLTAVVVGESHEGKPALAIEFTRMNPMHRRTIAGYVAKGTKKAA